MHHPDAVTCWRNRQAELEFHIRRHEWFVGKPVVLDQEALKQKIEAYQLEWSTYERLIRKVDAMHTSSRTKPAAA
jgi:hypothetical protein